MAIFGSNRAIALPFGAAAVAAPMAAILALAGMLVPTAWIESASFQLYLDALFPGAVAPFGTTAHIITALVLALAGALIGWILAKIFGVESNGVGWRSLLQRLRGEGAEDEADAPELRAEDRHPDAPARRPFSVSQDVRTDDSALPDLPPLPALDDTGLRVDGDDEPLILDHDFAQDDVPDDEPLVLSQMVTDDAPEMDVPEPVAVEEPVWQAPELPPAAPVVADPIDVSAMRLDQLLARLEQGLARRQPDGAAQDAPVETPVSHMGEVANDVDVAVEDVADGAPVPPPAGEMPVPDDPALAAALATLRRMRAHVG